MSTILLIIGLILTIVTGLWLVLQAAGIFALKNNNSKLILLSTFVIGIVCIALSLFGGRMLEKINAYREGVLMESEEECKRDDAPFWCNL
jgi:uncharacterized protein with PQ loop repeat